MSRLFSLIVLLLFVSFSYAQFIYVDQQLSENCIKNYSIQNRDCSGSDGSAYKTIQSAAAVASPGTTILIRRGVYNEQLSPAVSGDENNYITFKNYENELVEITGTSLSPAVWIYQKNYIVIDGIVVRDVRRWLNALGCSHLLIKNCTFRNATDPGGSSKTGIFLQSCDHIKIRNNIIDESTQDNIGMVDCDYNLIEGNTVTKASHALWALKCCNYNVIRDNYFHNELQKIGEIYDCDGVGYGEGNFPKITSLDDTKHNVVENNVFAYTPSPRDASPYVGIQYAAQHGIIRNNIFYDCEGPPVSLTLYSDEAKNNYSNRIYHNIFCDNEFGGIQISGNASYNFSDQKIKNNIFFRNKFIQRDFRWSWYDELNGKPVQIFTGRYNEIVIESNNIFNSQPDELYIIAYGNRFSDTNPDPKPLSWWETNNGTAFKNNLQTDPGFADETNRDFHLQPNSSMIDAGNFLAKTIKPGNKDTVMEIDDVTWFSDGFGIVPGDTVQVEGQASYAVVLSIDYTMKKMILDRAATWEADKGVGLKYSGIKPDIGAYEYPSRSTGLKIDPNSEKKAILFPNPTDGLLWFKEDYSNAIEEILVYNSLGNQVKEISGNELDISDLRSGFYLVKVTFEKGEETIYKVIKKQKF